MVACSLFFILRYSIDHAASIPHKTRQHNSNNRHPDSKEEDKFVFKRQLTQTNLANNRRIRRKYAWSTTATDTKLNAAYDTFKLIFKNQYN
jgi:hypothetical protein